jgi:hypothetical protein
MALTEEQNQRIKAAPDGQRFEIAPGVVYQKQGDSIMKVTPSPAPSVVPSPIPEHKWDIPPPPPSRSFAMEIPPMVGGFVGGFGGPVGSGVGGAAGEAVSQGVERVRGTRQSFNIPEMLKVGGEMAAADMLMPLVGPLLKGAGKGLVKAVTPRSKYMAKLVQRYGARPLWERSGLKSLGGEVRLPAPREPSATIVEQGMAGTEAMLGKQAIRKQKKIWENQIGPALKSVKQKIHMPAFFDDIEQQILRENTDPVLRDQLLGALKPYREKYEEKALQNVSLETLQNLKHDWASTISPKLFMDEDVASASMTVKDMLSSAARNHIYDTLKPEMKQPYLDYSNLYEIAKHGLKPLQRTLPLGGTSTLFAAIKDLALTPVATVGGQILYKTGQGMELIGRPGARVVGDILVGMSEVGKDTSGLPQLLQPTPGATPVPLPTPPQGAP